MKRDPITGSRRGDDKEPRSNGTRAQRVYDGPRSRDPSRDVPLVPHFLPTLRETIARASIQLDPRRRGSIDCPNCRSLGSALPHRLWFTKFKDGTFAGSCNGPCNVSFHSWKTL